MRPHTITYPPDGVEPIGVIEFVHGMCETRNRYAAPMEDIYVPLPICVDTEKTY